MDGGAVEDAADMIVVLGNAYWIGLPSLLNPTNKLSLLVVFVTSRTTSLAVLKPGMTIRSVPKFGLKGVMVLFVFLKATADMPLSRVSVMFNVAGETFVGKNRKKANE